MMKRLLPVLLLCPALALAAKPLPLVFSCPPGNDLYRVLSQSAKGYPRYASAAEAVARAPRGSGVLILAAGYPQKTTPVDAALFEKAAKKRLRLFVEYPSMLPGLGLGEPRTAQWERAVVASPAFGPLLGQMRILGMHRASFLPVTAPQADIVMARVAGFDTAVYGLPESGVYPILFELPGRGIMAATTQLSQFATARFAPHEAWGAVWKRVLGWLTKGLDVPEPEWTPTVRPTYAAQEAPPGDAELAAFRRASAVYSNARLLVHPSWMAEVEKRGKVNDSVHPAPPADWPAGDGRQGVLEGFSSSVGPDGAQPVRWSLRGDCNGEVSFHMALWSKIDQQPEAGRIAANLNEFLYRQSALSRGSRNDPRSPSYGLLGWGFPGSEGVYYGDDNARAMLGTIGAAAVLGSDRWDEPLLRCLLANLRTTGKLGFRKNRIDEAPLQKSGWRHYFDESNTSYAPHYQAYLWACFLWAYQTTGHQPFLDRASNAIRMTMAAYPNQWRWTNGIQQERARMLLPLAWLVRVQDTPEHRRWLRQIAGDVLQAQDASGAIREELGPAGKGDYPPAASNEAYGKTESTLIQRNGDPVSDMLYTTNFAFLGLHEAAAATGDEYYRNANNRLARFLCRIQTRSQAHPELDGWWFRAFDFRRWGYWGSNADAGWGVWSTETGWTQSWIASVLGMRQMNASLWTLSVSSRIGTQLKEVLPQMMPQP